MTSSTPQPSASAEDRAIQSAERRSRNWCYAAMVLCILTVGGLINLSAEAQKAVPSYEVSPVASDTAWAVACAVLTAFCLVMAFYHQRQALGLRTAQALGRRSPRRAVIR